MDKPGAVMVCGQVPARNAQQAGQKTAFAYLVELARTHVVDLLIACKAEDATQDTTVLEALSRHARSVEFVSLSAIGRVVALVRGVCRGLAPLFGSRCSVRVEDAFGALVARVQPEVVWLEFSQVFWLIESVPRGVRTVVSAHDVYTQLVASRPGVQLLCLLGLTYRCEKRLLDQASRVRVQTPKDAALLESFFRLPLSKIEVAAPALSDFLDTLQRAPDGIEPRSILFWGAMGRPENADAAVEFVARDFPVLLQRNPGAKLYVVGSNPTSAVRALAGPSVDVTGFVVDPAPYFERCSVGIAPLTSGAGVKVKVLEMLRAGIPVVSTRVGAEGIPANPLLNVVERPNMAEAIERVWR